MNLNFWTIGQRCAAIRLQEETPVIDLSDVTFVTPFALMYLGMLLRHYNSQGKRFNVRPPSNGTVRGYLARQRFWERFNFDPAFVTEEAKRRDPTTTSLNDIIDLDRSDPNLADRLADHVVTVLRTNTSALPFVRVEETVAELVQNFLDHTDEQWAAFMVQYYPGNHTFSIAIGDCVPGIHAVLSSYPDYAYLAQRPHREAAMEAFQYGVSSKGEAGGAGFSTILEGVSYLHGELRLARGDEYVIVTDQMRRAGPVGFDLPGVQVELLFQSADSEGA